MDHARFVERWNITQLCVRKMLSTSGKKGGTVETINTQKFISEVAALIADRPNSECKKCRLIVEDGRMRIMPVCYKVKLEQIFFVFSSMELEQGLTTERWTRLESQAGRIKEAISKCKISSKH